MRQTNQPRAGKRSVTLGSVEPSGSEELGWGGKKSKSSPTAGELPLRGASNQDKLLSWLRG
jgi:hypothetical protein